MNDTTKIDEFSARLAAELGALSWNDRNELLIRIGNNELAMREQGQVRPVWRGPVPESRILGRDVVIQTSVGEVRGRVICFGIVGGGELFERSVVVHVPSSGTQHEAAGSVTRLADKGDSERIQGEMAMAARLIAATKVVQAGPTPLPEGSIPKRRGQKDPKLIERMLAAANASQNVRSVDDAATNHKVIGVDDRRRVYVFKNQLRVDVSGFSFDHPGMRRITDDEARDMHLGKVRGQLIFDDRELAFAAFETALSLLRG